MNKLITLSVIFALILNLGFVSYPYAQTEEIEAIEVAKELAAKADGRYVAGETSPTLTGGEVALPVMDEETGNIIGYVVADRAKLVSALNDAGLTNIADVLAAAEAGATAGETVATGLFSGTTGTIAIGVSVLAGIALAIGGGGGGGGGVTTSHH